MSRATVRRTCPVCGGHFHIFLGEAARGGRRYCSDSCARANHPGRPPLEPTERFYLRVIPEESGCWMWAGQYSAPNQPVISVPSGTARGRQHDYRNVNLRRWVYEMYHGALDARHRVSMKCKNGHCVNPAHMVAKATGPVRKVRRTQHDRA